jgi:hypothetical protein
MYNLKTRAITTDRNGTVYGYDVVLEPSRWDGDESLVLRIKDTPGSWYLSTLFGKDEFSFSRPVGETISIDTGQNWDCINMGDIMREVRSMLGVSINPADFSPIEASAMSVPAPLRGINENLQLIAGKGSVTLHRVQNHAGDVYFRLRAQTYHDGRRDCFTLIEYSSADLARTEFDRMTGGN